MSLRERPEYMKWVTGNVNTFAPNEQNLVACVYCRDIYETTNLRQTHNCLVCKNCGIDAVMLVKNSPLHGLALEEQQKLLEKWHAQGFLEYN